jgi:hypothetical protein
MKKFIVAILILILLPAACTSIGASEATQLPAASVAATSQPEVISPTVQNMVQELSTDYENSVSTSLQLLAGILKLQENNLGLNVDQAASLLSIWQGVAPLNQPGQGQPGTPPDQNATPQTPVVSAELQQATETAYSSSLAILTVDQVQAISAMKITQDDLQTVMQQYGFNVGQGTPPAGMNGQNGSVTQGNPPQGNPPQAPGTDGTNKGVPPQGLMPGRNGMETSRLIQSLVQYLTQLTGTQSTTSNSQPAAQIPGGSGNSGLAESASGAYTLDGTSESKDSAVYSAKLDDQSAILLTDGANLTLTNSTVNSSGNSSSSDNSSFYGLNAVVLVNKASTAVISGTTVNSSGAGANGVFAEGSGTSITLTDVTINATGQYAHGVMATNAGVLTLTNVNITTAGANSGVIATDRGGGTITATGGTVLATGQDSPGIYSTGVITVSDANVSATGAEAAVIEGANSIELNNTELSSSKADKWGVMIYQSMSGDAEGKNGVFTMNAGALTYSGANGPLFYVTNTNAVIYLNNVEISSASGILLNAAAGSWGNSGSNGGTAVLNASAQQLSGDVTADSISSVDIIMESGSALTGAINTAKTAASANLTLDATSSWSVTADSYLTKLSGAVVSGDMVSNISGNGHMVYYMTSANPDLGGKTYSLAGGGFLKPLQ